MPTDEPPTPARAGTPPTCEHGRVGGAFCPYCRPPLPVVLHCPRCYTQHVDAPEPERGWTNPPHKSHLCHRCGLIWRPADVVTVGVERAETVGRADTWPPPLMPPAAPACRICNDTGKVVGGDAPCPELCAARPAPSPSASADVGSPQGYAVIERAKRLIAMAEEVREDLRRRHAGDDQVYADIVQVDCHDLISLARALLDADSHIERLNEWGHSWEATAAKLARECNELESRLAESEAARARLMEIAAKVPHLVMTAEGLRYGGVGDVRFVDHATDDCARLGGACAFAEAAAREGK